MAERSFEATCDYVRAREQFGRPIGSFQAVKHRLADVLLAVESARSAVRAAAVQVETGEAQATLSVAVAALVATEASLLATEEAVQLHGGIGFTWEHDAHLWFRRALSCEALQGGVGRRRDEVVTALGWAS